MDEEFELKEAPTTELPRQGNWLETLRREFDNYYKEMKNFSGLEPDQVFNQLAAWIARAYEVRGQLQRVQNTAARSLVSREVDPLIEACKQVFQIYSRRLTARQSEWEMSKGFV